MYSAIARNKRNTWFILIGFVLVLGLIGLLAGWLAGNNWWITAFILVVSPRGTRPSSTSWRTVRPWPCREPSRSQQAEAPRYYRTRREPLHHDGHADAEALRRRGSGAQRLRHGTQARGGRAITVTTGLFEHDDRPLSSRACSATS